MTDPAMLLETSDSVARRETPSRATTKTAILCIGGPALQTAISSSASRSTRVIQWVNEDSATQQWANLEPAVIVIEIGGAEIREPSAMVARARERWPRAYLIGYCSIGAKTNEDLLLSARAGLDAIGFVVRGDIDRLLQYGLAVHADRADGERLSRLVAQSLHPLAARVAVYVVAHAAIAPNVNDVARALGCTPRSLTRRFARDGLPTPDTLITRLRWLRIAELLAKAQFTSGEVARISGFSSVRAMRAALMRRLGIGLKQVAETTTREHLSRLLVREFGSRPIADRETQIRDV